MADDGQREISPRCSSSPMTGAGTRRAASTSSATCWIGTRSSGSTPSARARPGSTSPRCPPRVGEAPPVAAPAGAADPERAGRSCIPTCRCSTRGCGPAFGSALDRRAQPAGCSCGNWPGSLSSLPAPPVAVTTLPIVADLIGRACRSRSWVYYCVDDFAEWPGLDGPALRRLEERVGRQGRRGRRRQRDTAGAGSPTDPGDRSTC